MSETTFLMKISHSNPVCREVMESKRVIESSLKSRLRPWLLVSLVIGCLSVLRCYSAGSLHSYLDETFPRVHDPDEDLDMETFVTKRGYNFSRYEIITSDGYHIEIFRLWNETSKNSSLLPVVIPAHFIGTSATYVMDRHSTGFLYADAGFDVWLNNGRGSRFGRKHSTLDPQKDHHKFYDFDLFELATIDLAEQLDFIIRETGSKKVNYVGISQGGPLLFALLSRKPSYNAVISKASMQGAYRSFCFSELYQWKVFGWPYNLLGDYALSPLTTSYILESDIRGCGRFLWLCKLLALKIGGFHSSHYINWTRMNVYGKHYPAGCSLKMFKWYGQSRGYTCEGEMREYDYDFGMLPRLLTRLGLRSSRNLRIYGTTEPPVFDPKNVKIDVKLYFSDGDTYVPPKEALKVQKDLNISDKNMHRIRDSRFSHFAFVVKARPHLIDQHSIDYFQGIDSVWNPEIYEDET